MYHGIINVYKEAGYTSFDVVARLRGICQQKKIGHTGTLDPDAVGVLPVCLGTGTRLCDMLTDETKEYVTTLHLGVVTDTQDLSGEVLQEKEVLATPEEVVCAIYSFLGEQEQLPPMYSAIKVNGQRLYELARQGREVERKKRPVHFYELEVLEQKHPDYVIRVVCSRGTYIRTLCHDIGQKLGCGAAMAKLIRTRVGPFGIQDALKLDELQRMRDEGTLDQKIISVPQMFPDYPDRRVLADADKALLNGNALLLKQLEPGTSPVEGEKALVYSSYGEFCGIYYFSGQKNCFLPDKMFLSNM